MLLSQDLPLILTLLAASITAILAGSLLISRGQIMLTEAASHAVLPGLILGFLWSGDHGLGILLGSAGVIALFVVLTTWLSRRHALGEGVEIAALFPVFFGAGILLLSLSGLEQTGAIDVDHVLFGSLELIIWLDVWALSDLLQPSVWAAAPSQLLTALGAMAIALVLVTAFYPHFKRSLMDASGHRLSTPVAAILSRATEVVLIALASAACLRTTGVVVSIALFAGPVIAGWRFSRSLLELWLFAGFFAGLAIVLTLLTGWASVTSFGLEPRTSGVLALWLVALALLAPGLAHLAGRKRPAP